jgi:hypothetical protein
MSSDFKPVINAIEEHGMDIAIRQHSNFMEVEDDKFHELRRAYCEAAVNLENYITAQTRPLAFEDSEHYPLVHPESLVKAQ